MIPAKHFLSRVPYLDQKYKPKESKNVLARFYLIKNKEEEKEYKKDEKMKKESIRVFPS